MRATYRCPTPLEDRRRTLCLFFLIPPVEASTLASPAFLFRDLYTAIASSVASFGGAARKFR